MRYLMGFVLAMAAVAPPLSVSAQAGEDGASSEPPAQRPVTEPASKEPALQLEVDDAGVHVTPSPALTPDGYTLEEAEHRVNDARAAVMAMSLPLVVGVVLLGVSGMEICVLGPCEKMFGRGVAIGGGVMMAVGVGGIVGFGMSLAKRNADLEALKVKGQQRRAHWDLARSRLVF
jgi:hypothetical protein